MCYVSCVFFNRSGRSIDRLIRGGSSLHVYVKPPSPSHTHNPKHPNNKPTKDGRRAERRGGQRSPRPGGHRRRGGRFDGGAHAPHAVGPGFGRVHGAAREAEGEDRGGWGIVGMGLLVGWGWVEWMCTGGVGCAFTSSPSPRIHPSIDPPTVPLQTPQQTTYSHTCRSAPPACATRRRPWPPRPSGDGSGSTSWSPPPSSSSP